VPCEVFASELESSPTFYTLFTKHKSKQSSEGWSNVRLVPIGQHWHKSKETQIYHKIWRPHFEFTLCSPTMHEHTPRIHPVISAGQYHFIKICLSSQIVAGYPSIQCHKLGGTGRIWPVAGRNSGNVWNGFTHFRVEYKIFPVQILAIFSPKSPTNRE
jgi:hypothetical protein